MKTLNAVFLFSSLVYSTLTMADNQPLSAAKPDFYYSIQISSQDVIDDKHSNIQHHQLVCYSTEPCEETLKNTYSDLVARSYAKGYEPKEANPESESLNLKMIFDSQNQAILSLKNQHQNESSTGIGEIATQEQHQSIDLPLVNGLLKKYHFSFDNVYGQAKREVDIKIIRLGTIS
jgi:hypothetical protein